MRYTIKVYLIGEQLPIVFHQEEREAAIKRAHTAKLHLHIRLIVIIDEFGEEPDVIVR